MELGKIQKAWLADLRKYPERQGSSFLAKKNIDNDITQACCLGQGLLTLCELEAKEPIWECSNSHKDYVLSDFVQSQSSLVSSFPKLGLRGSLGDLLNPVVIGNESYHSLAQMNDNSISWSDIADYIEANPKNFFQESR